MTEENERLRANNTSQHVEGGCSDATEVNDHFTLSGPFQAHIFEIIDGSVNVGEIPTALFT